MSATSAEAMGVSRTFLHSPVFNPVGDAADRAEGGPKMPENIAMAMLQAHCAVLAGVGITDLGALGNLALGGNVVVPKGLVKPSVLNQRRKTTLFQHAYQMRPSAQGPQFQKISGTASLLTAEPLTRRTPVPPAAAGSFGGMAGIDLLVNFSYLVAETLTLGTGSNLILLSPLQHLVILVEHLVLGPNVTITYERSPVTQPVTPPKPAKPGTPSQPAPFSKGYRGTDGTPGVKGGMGPSFNTAPQIQIWALDVSGSLAVDLRGQDGGQGGQGGPGGDGGNGGQGSRGVDAMFGCKSGPGSGGDGATGGRAGDGGQGGNGGPGGRLMVFTTSTEIADIVTAGFYVSVDGGQGGAGGAPGVPGAGGAGGPVGGYPNSCKGAAAGRTPGAAGAQGAAGLSGPAGQAGPVSGTDPIKFVPILASDFTTALLKPAIISLSASAAHEGDQVSVSGKDLATTDVVKCQVDATTVVVCPTTVFSNTSATFVVPALQGGPRTIFIEQADGTRTNPTTLYVLPTVTGVENGPRVRPGTTVKIFGTGLAPGARLIINNLDVGPTTYLDPHTVSAVIVRPSAGVQPNSDGEVVDLRIALQDLTMSNPVQIVLDTYKILVAGDSVAWGCGLTPSDKFSTLVGQRVQQNSGGAIGVYTDVAAHTGAIIGRTNTDVKPKLDGEVPSSWPTVFQQVAELAARPNAQFVDLVLVDGGINDVKLKTIFNWTSNADLPALISQHCLADMKDLLAAVGNAFSTARVIVTGYFAPLSAQSGDALAERFVIALLAAFGFEILAVDGPQLALIHARCALFANQANQRLAQAVTETNAAFGGTPRFYFADPGFGPDNAAFADDPWLFGINADFSAQDAMKADRAQSCAAQAADDSAFCTRASMGHPNAAGAAAYAAAIYPFLV